MVDQSGIGVATRNSVQALESQGVAVTRDPTADYDLLHLEWIGPKSLYYARWAHKRGRPVVLSVHTPPDLIQGSFTFSRTLAHIYGEYLRRFAHAVDLFIAPSPFAAQGLNRIANGRPICVISSGIDLDRFRYDEGKRVSFRRAYNLDRPTVLCTGQVIPRKGIEDFLTVARLLPDVSFIWVGARVNRLLFYSPRFERLLKHHPENVRFTGFIDDVGAAYSGSDLFLFPSHGESLGLVILEAAATGLPLVVRRLPVYRGWLHEGTDCAMGETPQEFATAIRALLDRQEGRSRGGSHVVQGHSLPQVGEDLLAAYQEIL
ncbi:MAG: glycosyltransferase family 4 protein [Candidatus Bipolaricaulota bacterium]|nr:glycosyltransferase family 4 protein [Candidatus Bipolaricaulota bacterium]